MGQKAATPSPLGDDKNIRCLSLRRSSFMVGEEGGAEEQEDLVVWHQNEPGQRLL